MKNCILNKSGLFLTIGFCLMSNTVLSQNIKSDRQERKEAKKAEKYANFQAIDTLLQIKSFVLEAYNLESRHRNRESVDPSRNFIIVNLTKAVVGTGSSTWIYANELGVGGTPNSTVDGTSREGNISQYKTEKNLKKLSNSVKFNINVRGGTYNVLMVIGADKSAYATVTTAIGSGYLTMYGRIVTIRNSSAYKNYSNGLR